MLTQNTRDLFDPSDDDAPILIPRPPVATQRPYYDAESDKSAQARYYQDFELAPEGQEAFKQLHLLSSQKHTQHLKYDPNKYLYPWVDIRPNQQLASIYSPDSVTEISSAKQAAIDLKVAELGGLAAFSPETIANQIGIIVGQSRLNCEHVVPQSWYSSAEPMRGDLHHLFACESRCNSFRGSRPLRDSKPTNADADQVTKCGIRTDNDKGFSPMAGRGAVARATLYFLVRYPKKAKSYTEADIKDLIRWHEKEPPSLYEKHRNAAIEELQGNRNPFIDRPEWARKVDFSAGLRKPRAAQS